MTPGQIFWEAAYPETYSVPWNDLTDASIEQFEAGAKAVIDAHVSEHDDLIVLLAGLVREAFSNVKHNFFWAGWKVRAQNALSRVQGAPSGPPHTHDTKQPADAPTARSGALSRQVDGDHYHQAGIQPWDIWEAYSLDPWEANAVKYILRRKPGVDRVTDLKKAAHYLERCIERCIEREAEK